MADTAHRAAEGGDAFDISFFTASSPDAWALEGEFPREFLASIAPSTGVDLSAADSADLALNLMAQPAQSWAPVGVAAPPGAAMGGVVAPLQLPLPPSPLHARLSNSQMVDEGDGAEAKGDVPFFPFVVAPALAPSVDPWLGGMPDAAESQPQPQPQPQPESQPQPGASAGSPTGSSASAAMSPGVASKPQPRDRAAAAAAAAAEDTHVAAATASGAQRKRSSRLLDAAEWEERRRKHNEIEVKRRRMLNDSFEKLKDIVKAPTGSKGGVLEAAVSALRRYQEQTADLERRVVEKSATVEQLKRRKQEADQQRAVVAAASTLSDAQVEALEKPAWGGVPYFKAFLHSGVAMHVALMDGKIVDVNEKFEDLMHNSKTVLSNLSVFTITHSAYRPRCRTLFRNLLSGERDSESGNNMIVNCRGEVLSVHVTTWTVKEDGKPKYVVAMVVPLEVEPKHPRAAGKGHHSPRGEADAAGSATASPALSTPTAGAAAEAAPPCEGRMADIEVVNDE
jgi:PAS domain S-box-containing protein